MNIIDNTGFTKLTDLELIELLHTMGDALPRDAVDEIIERGYRMAPYLCVIVSDKHAWSRPLPEWWAPIHATYILGAFEMPETITALLSALRWADAFDCEWVTEDLPSMFGKLGKAAYGPLQAIVRDESAGWGARSIALSSMAATTLNAEFLRETFLDFTASILDSETEPVPLRQAAANILMDLHAVHHKPLLLRFGREEAKRKEEIPNYEGAFYDWEVDEFLAPEEKDSGLEFYRRDWLVFYDPEELDRRRDFWEEEREKHGEAGFAGALGGARTDGKAEEEDAFTPERYFIQCPCGSGKDFRECCNNKIH